jgi:hypothetical protein
MKRLIMALSTFALICAGSSLGPGVYAVKHVNQPAKYITYTGSWKGTETEGAGPLGLTDYNLTGKWVVKKVVWTINLTTDRGVLTGNIVFSSVPPAGGPSANTYEGPLTLITQGLPQASTGAAVPARGWIDASTYTNGVADGGSVLANAEFQINPAFGATGQFGDANASLAIPDYSVITTNQVC